MKKIWFDLTNVPHINFIKPIVKHFADKFEYLYSLRDFAETVNLFKESIDEDHLVIGKHKGNNKLLKTFGLVERTFSLYRRIGDFDFKISVGGDSSNYVAKMKRKFSITFDDNEMAPNWRYSRFSDYSFWPKAVDTNVLLKQGFKENKLYQYNGLKEQFYIADYIPDPNFKKHIPFDKYVVVRPENISANYVDSRASICPILVKELIKNGYNIIYLPRYKHDINYVEKHPSIYIPPTPLNGLDLCSNAELVLSGAGTLTREAACLGIPAISFYSGSELLTVDQFLIDSGSLNFSRDVKTIIKYTHSMTKSIQAQKEAQKVKNEILTKLEELLL